MQIELIAPASAATAALPRLGLGLLAGITPHEEFVYTDEIAGAFDVERDLKDVDLVGISVDSKTARRAYDIAAAYRARGVPVVVGGIHPTACPEEAMQHADAVVAGEGEGAWARVVEDVKAGALKPLYKPELPTLAGLPLPRRDLFRSNRYIPFDVVQTMRGCPYPCEFCSVSTQNGTTMRFRPADDVLAELPTVGKWLLFADDNVMIHRAYARDLFGRMAAHGKKWVGQCSLAAVRRLENVRLMAESGCRAILVGFESIDEETTRHTGKKQNRPAEYRETIAMLQDHGIAVWGTFVFGFDTDDVDVFDRTVEFAIEARLTMASFAMLCPYPGTALYRRLAAEGRLTDPHWWLRPNEERDAPHFVPRQMTRTQLREGWARAWQRCYSWQSMWHRYRPTRRSSVLDTVGFWPLNLIQRHQSRRRAVAVPC
jgi:radical SAM superfamily enzyme YgiQ (UPF0313 family)